MSDWKEYTLATVFVVAGAALVIGLVTCFAFASTAIAWLLYNKAVAPAFGWPHASFWLVFAFMWFLSFFVRLWSRRP